MSGYVFDNAAPQSAQRFESLETLHDRTTVSHLEALGVGEGWECWEIGAGGGSVADWLARHVGASGHVLVTDLDPRFLIPLQSPGRANVEVQRHDVAHDPLPAKQFDLIHARLVLLHIPTADQVLPQLALALKPGGYLFLEDYDPSFLDRTFPTTEQEAAGIFGRAYDAVQEVLASHGRPPGWGRSLYQRLLAVGLVDVRMEGHLAVWSGGSVRARLDRANIEQVRVEALERGLITENEIVQTFAQLDDPTFHFSSPIMFSAWGRRPAS